MKMSDLKAGDMGRVVADAHGWKKGEVVKVFQGKKGPSISVNHGQELFLDPDPYFSVCSEIYVEKI